MTNDIEAPKKGGLLTVQEVSMLDGLNMQVAKICVWAHHFNRFEQGIMLLRQQHCDYSEALLRDVGRFFRALWQIDAPRNERDRCFLCNAKLPDHSDELCKCFRECQVGRYFDPITPQTIEELKRSYPQDWYKITIETVLCENLPCGRLMSITAGVVSARFQKGKGWKTPKLCMTCFNEKQAMFNNSPPRRPPLRAPLQDANKGKLDLRELQQTVAAESPEVGES